MSVYDRCIMIKPPLIEDYCRLDHNICLKDISIIICIRAEYSNPWVIDRLNFLKNYYDPCPKLHIIDFGSDEYHSKIIEEICRSNGFLYHFEEDYGVYSPAIARNRGFEKTDTDLIFFCDIDFFLPVDAFRHLAYVASILDMKNIIDNVLVCHAYHLGEEQTRTVMACNASQRKSVLDSLACDMALKAQEDGGFIAPYSNVFLINRKFFSLIGGYDESFRGHGSEDFEFLIRAFSYQNVLPHPHDMRADINGPLRDGFYAAERPYQGFRAYLELASYLAVAFGLRAFHLFHPRQEGAWREERDLKRARFNKALDAYLDRFHRLLSVDYLNRQKTMVCFCKHADHWGYFLPFRLAGYRLLPCYSDSDADLSAVTDGIIKKQIDGVAIFNPYMRSHERFLPLVHLARENGCEVVVIERGALPQTIYYDEDVAYVSKNYSEDEFQKATYSPQELMIAGAYIDRLKSGKYTLESMAGYDETLSRHQALINQQRKIIFIPLQLDDDTAVTLFTKGRQSYQDFVGSIEGVVRNYKDITFLIKKHPLSNRNAIIDEKNVIVLNGDDNVHAIIDISDAIVCYNSGVGLLSLLQGKPTVVLGNAFYSRGGLGTRASSFAEAIAALYGDSVPVPDQAEKVRLAAWFLHRRYSSFISL